MRSFIKPRKKKLFDDMTSLWFGFIIIIAIALVIFGILVNYKSSFYIKMLENLSTNNGSQTQVINNLQHKVMIINMQVTLDKEVKGTNKVLKESI